MTIEELAEFMSRQPPMTYDVFDQHRDEDNDYNDYNTASWARGRIDAYLQIMAIIDKDREEMLRAEWERVVTGQGFMENDEE